MHLIAKAISISHAKCNCNRLDKCTRYSILRESHFLGHSVYTTCFSLAYLWLSFVFAMDG